MSFVTEIMLKRRVEAQEAMYQEMLDAAEFGARVAKKLAVWGAEEGPNCPQDEACYACKFSYEMSDGTYGCEYKDSVPKVDWWDVDCFYDYLSTAEHILMAARILVEEEMDG